MSEPAVGTVEDVTLRVTRIWSVSGEVITTPNGLITQVTNLSRDWARAVIDVPVPAAVEVSRVTDMLKRVGEEAWNDDPFRKMMLDPPTVMGVERIEVDTFSVRMVARTLPGMQFDVGRELRARVASAFRHEGINVSAALDTGRATGAPHERPHEQAAPHLDHRPGRPVPGRVRAVHPGATRLRRPGGNGPARHQLDHRAQPHAVCVQPDRVTQPVSHAESSRSAIPSRSPEPGESAAPSQSPASSPSPYRLSGTPGSSPTPSLP